VQGLLADVNVAGQVEYLIQQMQMDYWVDLWNALGLVLRHFEEVGLTAYASDLLIWQTCQAQHLTLVTDNRNLDSADSMEATIRQHNTAESLPVFTIADLGKFARQRPYADRVLEKMYDYLLRIDALRGTGRLFLP
jgi:hypothetical protein